MTGDDVPAGGLVAPDGGERVNLIVPEEELPAKLAEAATLPAVPMTDIDVNWLQVSGKGSGTPPQPFLECTPTYRA